VLRLERQAAHAWELVAACQRMLATRVHTLPAGQSRDVLLTAPGQWPQGVYRARLDYTLPATEGSAAAQKTSVSCTFRID
jgi:sarcosine oxidase gamma subunit